MAGLVAPRQVVLCEGANPSDGFDATIYRSIFAEEFPDVEFLSVGNSSEVKRDHAGIASAIEVLAPGTRILRLIDRDEHTDDEIASLQKRNIRVLNRRNIESYLLADEVLSQTLREGRVKSTRSTKPSNVGTWGSRPGGSPRTASGRLQVSPRVHPSVCPKGTGSPPLRQQRRRVSTQTCCSTHPGHRRIPRIATGHSWLVQQDRPDQVDKRPDQS